jgi:hypothetical protein
MGYYSEPESLGRGRYRGVARVDELTRMGLHIGQHVLLVIFRKRIGIDCFFQLSAKTDLDKSYSRSPDVTRARATLRARVRRGGRWGYVSVQAAGPE